MTKAAIGVAFDGPQIGPAQFSGILFDEANGDAQRETSAPPECFADLFLGQIVDSITAGKQEYNLKPFFHTALHHIASVEYRHEIFRDMENKRVFEIVETFANDMRQMRQHVTQAGKLHYRYQKEIWFVDAVEIYCGAVAGLTGELSVAKPASRGFKAFHQFLTGYAASEAFASLAAEIEAVKAGLAAIKYSMLIKGIEIRVRKFDAEIDYGSEVLATFEKFKRGAAKDHLAKFNDWVEMNHVEAVVLDMVAKLYPEEFGRLNAFFEKHTNYLDPAITAFDREIQFYVAVLDHIATFKRAGLKFCYPRVSDSDKQIFVDDGFDLALANKLNAEKSPIVCNDFHLVGKERVFVVSGPNQGGKTTFARMFGQLHYLASLGCPVPGSKAKLYLFDTLFTHFEREEDLQNLRGKLEDELVRMHEILEQATPRSVIVINEIFTSTTLKDAIFLGKKVMEKIMQLDLLCVCVTFIDELSNLGAKTVSAASMIVPENPAQRTFKIERKPADGLAYAVAIAEKYRLTFNSVKKRIAS